MKPTFLKYDRPLLTVMLQCETPEVAIGRIRNANCTGGEAFGLQVESLKPEYHNPDAYKRIFAEMQGKPSYVTYYRSSYNQGKSDEELAKELITIAKSGGTLCDVIGDFFDRQPDEVARDEDAIKKQMELIDKLHDAGAEVLMSSHILKFTPAERVLEVALEQKRRGADIIKIVVTADTMQEQIENLRINQLLSTELDTPFLFLSGGKFSSIHRRLGIKLGCCMSLVVYEHDHLSTAPQPLLSIEKEIRDNLGF